ncbi:MAG TPA: DUF4412 domain-containing protein [Vicinamibacteria bacterium]|nr:DUF4412 domain-containing protein [Vicinamibacteria bacterium]
MRAFKRSVALAGGALVLAALPAAAEDLTIVFKDGKGATETQYYAAGKMRNAAGDHDSIMDFSTGTITTIDHKRKEYSQVTLDQLEAAMKQASAQMEQSMANVPPAMRERMEQMMGGAMGEVTVTKGGTKKVAGYDTQQYTVTMGETVKNELWNTTALQVPIDPAQFRKMAGFSSSFAGGPMMRGMAKMAEKMKEIQGLTLAQSTSVKMMGRANETSREAVEVKKGAVPAATFAVPAGYKKVESPMLKMGRQ